MVARACSLLRILAMLHQNIKLLPIFLVLLSFLRVLLTGGYGLSEGQEDFISLSFDGTREIKGSSSLIPLARIILQVR